jgi:hypothetical protein
VAIGAQRGDGSDQVMGAPPIGRPLRVYRAQVEQSAALLAETDQPRQEHSRSATWDADRTWLLSAAPRLTSGAW